MCLSMSGLASVHIHCTVIHVHACLLTFTLFYLSLMLCVVAVEHPVTGGVPSPPSLPPKPPDKTLRL